MRKGIFWLVESELLTVKVTCDESGTALEEVIYSSESGENFNHKAEWEKLPHKVTHGKPYNYYPRGRVEIKNGKALIFLNPDLNTEKIQAKIVSEFSLETVPTVNFKTDGSAHYHALY